MTQAISGLGTALTRAGHKIAEINNINGVELTAKTIDVTNHDSPGWAEKISGLRDGGKVTVDGNFIAGDADGQIALASDLASGAVQIYVITLPDGTTWTFDALVTKFGTKEPHDKEVSFSAELEVTGQPILGVLMSVGLTAPYFVLSDGDATVAPAKAGNVALFTANVGTATASITITPTAAAGTIKVNGNVVASGTASSAIPLVLGPNEITIEVREAGKAARIYQIIVTRALAS